MTTLHLEVETARGTQSTISNTENQVSSLVQSMTSNVNGLQPAWLGNSATEFFNDYEQWRTAMNNLLESLNTLGTRLGNEISQWEAAAAHLD